MRTLLGLILLIVGALGTIFFRRYHGNVIPYPTVWYIAFFILGMLGIWLVYKAAIRLTNMVDRHVSSETEKLKSNAIRIIVDIDKCEFKSGSFSHEVEDQNMSAVKLFAPGTLASIETTTTENVIQSYLVYTDVINGEHCRFVSQSFPFDPTTLRFYILNQDMTLYIDRIDSRKYLFELKK